MISDDKGLTTHLVDSAMREEKTISKTLNLKWITPSVYIFFLMLPIYWLINMSFKSNQEILSSFTLFPENPTLGNYVVIFSDPSWYNGYINSMIYVALNMVISISVALPAAYAFSRYRFLGDKHMFFWLLSNRMAPAAVFVLPFFQLYFSFALFYSLIRVAFRLCLFNFPWPVWILWVFM